MRKKKKPSGCRKARQEASDYNIPKEAVRAATAQIQRQADQQLLRHVTTVSVLSAKPRSDPTIKASTAAPTLRASTAIPTTTMILFIGRLLLRKQNRTLAA
jgi:hypothetical protein